MVLVSRHAWFAHCVVAALLVCALPGLAQLQVGDDLKLNLSGDASFGYSGDFGNVSSSDHTHTMGGDGNLTGSYYNPAFLSFAFLPYYNRSQANSAFQSISDTSGFTANANFFSGSHFPGTISFNKAYDSTGEFGIPGLTGYTTHGNTQAFAIGWSALLPDMPTLTASYSQGTGTSSIYGTDSENSSTNRIFALRSTYLWKGFHLSGGYAHQANDATFPEFLLSGQTENSSGSSNTYQISASHSFPLQGAFAAAFTRVDYGYQFQGSNPSTGTSDAANATVSIRPVDKLTFAVNTNYTDSLASYLPQEVLNAGVPQLYLSQFRSIFVNATALWMVRSNLSVQGQVGRQEQYFLGQDYGATTVNGTVNYNLSRPLFGVLTFSLGVVDTATKEGNTGLGVVGSVNFLRKIDRWDIAGNFIYSQNTQTLVSVYTTSAYNYATSVSRKFNNRIYWNVGFSGSHSGFSAQPGSSNAAERVSTSLFYRGYGVNGYWSTSAGTSVLTGSGLVPLPPTLPPGVLPSADVILFNGSAYGVGATATPLRRLLITGNYSRAFGSTLSPQVNASNRTDIASGLLRYQLRKLTLNAGFTRFTQGIGAGVLFPVTVNSYYCGISRWFNFF